MATYGRFLGLVFFMIALATDGADVTQSRPEPPSPNFKVRQEGRYSVSYPANWVVEKLWNDTTLAFSPASAIRRTKGRVDRTTGMLVGIAPIKTAGLREATDELIQTALTPGNPELRVLRREARSIAIGDQPADSLLLEEPSPLAGEQELDWLVSTLRPEGLFWVLFISPQRDFAGMGATDWRILQSIQFSGGSNPTPSPVTARPANPGNWIRYAEPNAGFVVQHPVRWKVDVRKGPLIFIESPDDGAFVLVHPFSLKPLSDTKTFLAEVPRYLPSVFPQGQVSRYGQLHQRPDEALATIQFIAAGHPATATVLCSLDGPAGMLYAIAGPHQEFPRLRDDLVGILQSFKFVTPSGGAQSTGVATGQAQPQLKFVRWQDPKEQAFSIEVPQGWRVSGGMFRMAPVDTRSGVELDSPDGRIHVLAGDPQVPPFIQPSPTLGMTGFREGSWYNSPYGVKVMVRRYATGLQFAREYAASKFQRSCAGFRVVHEQDRADIAGKFGGNLQQIGNGVLSQKLTFGEVAFTCSVNGQPMRGFVFAGTHGTTASGIGMWKASNIGGYLAAADLTSVAESVLMKMTTSTQVNQQWVAGQHYLTAEQGAIVQDVHQKAMQVINDTYWSRQAIHDNESRHFSNYMLDLTDVYDPATGERWKVESGHNYYWRRDYTDVVAGTPTYDRPDINFSPLIEY